MLDRTWTRVGHGREGKQEEKKWVNLLGRLVTEILTKYCMVAYECNVIHCAHVYHSNHQLTG